MNQGKSVLFDKLITIYTAKNAQYFKQNKIEVCRIYRQLLKDVPKTLDRKLQKISRIKEIQYLFKESANLQFKEDIEFSKKIAYDVLNKIKEGKYPPFPQLSPNPIPADIRCANDIESQKEKFRKTPI